MRKGVLSMRKYQWIVIIMLLGFVFSVAGCNRVQKVLQPAMPDPEPMQTETVEVPMETEIVEMPVEEMPENIGIGIFDTSVMAGHGLLTEAYVPGGRLTHIPDFDALTPFRHSL